MSEVAELIKKVSQQLEDTSAQFNIKAEEALSMGKRNGKLTDDMKLEVDKLAVDFNGLNGCLQSLTAAVEGVEQHIAQMPVHGALKVAHTVGQQMLSHEGLKDLNSTMQANSRITVPVKAAITTPDLPSGVVEPDRLPGIDALPQQRLFIRDLIAKGRTQSNMIFYVQQTGFTNAAAVVAENTLKPESGIEFTEKNTPVRTIAHTFNASKQILDDMTQLASMVDVEMRYGLKLAEENEILFGDGTGAHLDGIIPQASAFDPAFTVEGATGIDALRLAMLQAQLARVPASGHVLHFIDWARIELTKDTLGRYILSNPAGVTGPTLWGLPVVTTEAAAFVGKFLTGAFALGAQLFDREDANVVISSENRDNFEKNMITIRCEERLALAVKRPEAFVFGSLSAAVAA